MQTSDPEALRSRSRPISMPPITLRGGSCGTGATLKTSRRKPACAPGEALLGSAVELVGAGLLAIGRDTSYMRLRDNRRQGPAVEVNEDRKRSAGYGDVATGASSRAF